MQQLSSQLAEAICQKELAQLDREWEIERQKYYIVTNRSGFRELPKTRTAITSIVAGGIFASLIILAAFALGLVILLLLAPVIGLSVMLIAVGISRYVRAKAYTIAFAHYQSRRCAIRPEQFDQVMLERMPATSAMTDEQVEQLLSDRLAEVNCQKELAQLDLQWEIERQTHYIATCRRGRFLPDSRMAATVLVFGASGLLVAVISFVLSKIGIPSLGLSALIFGVAAVLAFFRGIYLYGCAKAYEEALSNFQSRRAAIRREYSR